MDISSQGGQYVEGSLYYYAPNKEAPVIFAFLFFVSFVLHVWQSAKYKSWKITLMLPFSALVFTAGYILRAIGAYNYRNVNIYIASMTMIMSVPPLYEMQNYQLLSRLLYYVPYHSPLHPGRMLTTLAGLSTVVETLNGNGVSYSANLKLSHSKQSMGLIFLRIALITQLVLLTLFVTLTQYLHYRVKTFGPIPYPQNVKSILVTLWISSMLIGIRTVYRTVEYFSISSFLLTYSSDPVGSVSPIIKHEAFFWVFEASLMLANSCLLNVRNPMAVLPTDSRVYLAEDGARELPGPGYEDVRFFLVAMVDPFDLVGLLRGRGRRREFWKEGGEGNGVAADLEEGALTAGEGVAGQDDGIEGAGGVGKECSGSGQGAGSTVTVAVAGDVGPGDVGSGTGLTFDAAK